MGSRGGKSGLWVISEHSGRSLCEMIDHVVKIFFFSCSFRRAVLVKSQENGFLFGCRWFGGEGGGSPKSEHPSLNFSFHEAGVVRGSALSLPFSLSAALVKEAYLALSPSSTAPQTICTPPEKLFLFQ